MMAKCRSLLQENAELGKQLSQVSPTVSTSVLSVLSVETDTVLPSPPLPREESHS